MACCWTLKAAVFLAILGAAASQGSGHPLHHPDRPGLAARLEWREDSVARSAHCSMPPSLSLQLSVEGEVLPLSLTHHPHVASSAPRYSVTEAGVLSFSLPGVGDDHRSTYSNATQGATLVVVCRLRPGSPVVLTASGMVEFRGELHHLEPLSSDVSDSDFAHSYVLHPNAAPQTTQYASDPRAPEELEEDMEDEARQRRKRAVADLQDKHIILDFIAVGEYHLYDKFLGWATGSTAAEKRQNALNAVQDYMAVTLASAANVYVGVDLDMNVNIDIRLQGFVVMESTSAQPEFTAAVDSQNTSEADALLSALRTWTTNSISGSSIPATDGVVLFTTVDVYRNGIYGVAGIATTPSACSGPGTALVEFEQYHTYFHVAHEIGHTLSATHDTTACGGGDMMSASVSPSKTAKDWSFSNCSIASFKNYLGGLYSTHQSCLLGTFAASPSVTNYTQFPGAYLDLDRQCQLIKGPTASFCRACVPDDLTAEQICTNNQLPCRVGTTNVQNAGFPLPGTPCGSGKWCYKGQCVSSSLAPAKDESCLYGDQTAEEDFLSTGSADNCTTLIAQDPGTMCSQFGKQCCVTCKQYETGIGDACKYVDPSACGEHLQCGQDLGGGTYSDDICCNLCIYANFTPTTTAALTAASTASTATPVDVTTASTASVSTTPSTSTASVTSQTTASTSASCADTDSAAGSYGSCAAMVESARHLCYNVTLEALCCRSCRQSASTTADCEYGDKDPNQCSDPNAMQKRTTLCPTSSAVCCQTCAGWNQGRQLRPSFWLVLPALALVSTVCLTLT